MNKDQLITINFDKSSLQYLNSLRALNSNETDENLIKYLFMQAFYNLLEQSNQLNLEAILELAEIDVLISID